MGLKGEFAPLTSVLLLAANPAWRLTSLWMNLVRTPEGLSGNLLDFKGFLNSSCRVMGESADIMALGEYQFRLLLRQ
jgi:hypothetical protein